jgi:DNA-directed RNA polymerase specialized sigma subunit
MLTIDEAQTLMEKLIDLRTRAKESKDPQDVRNFKKQETLCVEKFGYLVTMKTSRYKSFANYQDLNQEGYEALLKGMKNYNPKKGNAFWWFHKYIDTRISRSANLHTTIRYPLKVAKALPPHKESTMPIMVEEKIVQINN